MNDEQKRADLRKIMTDELEKTKDYAKIEIEQIDTLKGWKGKLS
jgi:hypothetical protein